MNENAPAHYCPTCGRKVSKGEGFCRSCGTRLAGESKSETPARTPEDKEPARSKRRGRLNLLLLFAVILLVLVGADGWAYFAERRALLEYAELSEPDLGPGVDPQSEAFSSAQMRDAQQGASEAAEERDSVDGIFVTPVLPWHHNHRSAKASLVDYFSLSQEYSEIQVESWRLVASAFRAGEQRFLCDEGFTNCGYRLVPNKPLVDRAISNQQPAQRIEPRMGVLISQFRRYMGLDSESLTSVPCVLSAHCLPEPA